MQSLFVTSRPRVGWLKTIDSIELGDTAIQYVHLYFVDYRDIKDDKERTKDVQNIYKVLKSMVGESNLPYESDFIGIYGRVNI